MIDQGELFEIPNPCIGICTANSKGYCKGCLRSRQERFHWHELSPFQKQLVVNLCHKRRQKLLAGRHNIAEEAPAYTPQGDLFADNSASGASDLTDSKANNPGSESVFPTHNGAPDNQEPTDVREPVSSRNTEQKPEKQSLITTKKTSSATDKPPAKQTPSVEESSESTSQTTPSSGDQMGLF